MKNNKIGEILKQYRKLYNWSVEEVVVKLKEDYDLNVAEKTVYGWESNQAHPTTDTFISLCNLYKINNINETFNGETTKTDYITNEERRIIKAYRANKDLQNVVKKILDIDDSTN